MATTAREIFELSVHLMDENDAITGEADTALSREYKNRTLPILRVLQEECAAYSALPEGTRQAGERLACRALEDLEDEVGLDERLCRGVLPYGLAGHLLLDEDPDRANFFLQRYEELLLSLRQTAPVTFEGIDPSYGGVEMGEFAHW